jgi:tight adherence protein C
MIVFAAVTAALAVFVAVYTLVSPARPPAVSARLSRYERLEVSDRDAALAAPFVSRVGIPVVRKFTGLAGKLLPTSIVSGIEHRLVVAGEPVSLHAFFALQIGALGAAAVLLFITLTGDVTKVTLAAGAGGAVIVALVPIYWLRIRVSSRKKALLKALPDAVDLIVTSVEAGLAIDGALAEVGRETAGPLGEELRLTVRETTLGRSRRDAFLRLIDRTDLPELKTFVQSLIQAELTGVPIGQVLRTQAAQVRLKKRQHAEAEAQRAPVKMVVILVTLVLPAMLMLIMGPAVMRLQGGQF